MCLIFCLELWKTTRPMIYKYNLMNNRKKGYCVDTIWWHSPILFFLIKEN